MTLLRNDESMGFPHLGFRVSSLIIAQKQFRYASTKTASTKCVSEWSRLTYKETHGGVWSVCHCSQPYFQSSVLLFPESGWELQHELVAYRVQRLCNGCTRTLNKPSCGQVCTRPYVRGPVVGSRCIGSEGAEANWTQNSTDYLQQVGSFLLPRFCVYVIFS